MSWTDYASKSRSSKIALAHLFPREKVRSWSLVSGSVYTLNPRAYVYAIYLGTVELTEVTGTPGVNEWSYNSSTNVCLINTGVDPRGQDVIITYKFHFATSGLVLPENLSSGEDVEYQGRITNVDDLKLELDYENAGIALESTSSITLQNNDGFFDDLYDTLTWENQRAIFYSYGLELDPADARVIFNGYIDQKSFSSSVFKLTIKDAFKKLRDKVPLPVYSDADGSISDSTRGKAKRRIYGRMKNLQTVGIDKTLSGFELTGTFSAPVTGTTVTGTGSICLSQLTPDDEIQWVYNGVTSKLRVQEVLSDTSFTVSEALEIPIEGTITCKPKIPYRGKNRAWHIAGHECFDIVTTVDSFITPTRITLNSVEDMRPGDTLDYDNGTQFVDIRRISGNQVVLEQALSSIPVGGESITVPAVRGVYFNDTALVAGRDYTLLNNPSDCIVEIDPLAEYNVTRPFLTLANFTFTNGSRTVTHNTPDYDLTAFLQPRDWIRAYSITRPTFFEILSVESNALTLRIPYSEASFTGYGERKNVTYIEDSSLITVDVTGKAAADGRWARTASQVINDVILSDLLETNLNAAKFTDAETDAPELISYAIPKKAEDAAPIIRDVITDINRSVFGALYQDRDFKFTFSVLQADKDEDLSQIYEDDIISYSSQSKPAIANKTVINYRPFTDTLNGEDSFLVKTFDNEPVNQLSGILNTATATAYLYDDQAATDYSERLAFLRTATNTNVSLKGKINLNNYGLGDKVILNLNRMFKRFGGESNLKTALVYGISTDEANATLLLNDYNAMFTRVPAIAPDDADDYATAIDSDVAKFGYIVDNTTETPDVASDLGLGNNLIG